MRTFTTMYIANHRGTQYHHTSKDENEHDDDDDVDSEPKLQFIESFNVPASLPSNITSNTTSIIYTSMHPSKRSTFHVPMLRMPSEVSQTRYQGYNGTRSEVYLAGRSYLPNGTGPYILYDLSCLDCLCLTQRIFPRCCTLLTCMWGVLSSCNTCCGKC